MQNCYGFKIVWLSVCSFVLDMKARIELLEELAEAEDDVKNGRVAPITETFDDLRKISK